MLRPAPVEDELVMTPARMNTCRSVVLGLALALCVAACGKSSAEAPAEGAAFATLPPKTAAPTTLPIGAECTAEALKATASTKYPDVTLGEFRCTATFALATLFPKGGARAGLAGFFTAADNTWTLAADTAANGDVAAAAPPDFPADLVKQWQEAYVDPTKSPTTTSGGSGTGGPGGCQVGEDASCTTTTTARATTTTTSKSSTTSQTTPTTASTTSTTKPVTTTTKAGGGLG
jgi:hypothetical protein